VTVRAAIGIGAAASVLIGIFAAALLVRVRGGALALAPLALLLGIASAAIVARVASLPAEQAALVYSGDWPPEIAFGPWFAFTTAALPCLAAGLFALLLFPGRRRLPAVRRDT
jgi:hypothetical protein